MHVSMLAAMLTTALLASAMVSVEANTRTLQGARLLRSFNVVHYLQPFVRHSRTLGGTTGHRLALVRRCKHVNNSRKPSCPQHIAPFSYESEASMRCAIVCNLAAILQLLYSSNVTAEQLERGDYPVNLHCPGVDNTVTGGLTEHLSRSF